MTQSNDSGRFAIISVIHRLVVVFGLLVLTAGQVQAQQITPEQMQALQTFQDAQRRGTAQQTSQQPRQPIVLTPAEARTASPARSMLENLLSERAGVALSQFGYEVVGVGASVSVPQTGSVQDDYVLGPGDEIVAVLRGQENSQFSITVDRNGQVLLPKTEPVLAAGKRLGEFRQDLLAAISRAYVSTQAFVSLGQLRQVSVMVTGEVANPGVRIATGLSTPMDAILLSGGIKKSGSLRDIKLIRNGRTTAIDLYGVLAKRGDAHLVNLRDGDRIYVPPIGATAAVAGYVRRAAIFELAPGQQASSASELMALAGGAMLRGNFSASIERIMPDGRIHFLDISGQPGASVRDGEILIFKNSVDVTVGRVMLAGAVRTPGSFAVEKYKTLHDVLSSADVFQSGAYMLFGFIDRIDPVTLQHEAVPFSPLRVVAGRENVKLISLDSIYILTPETMQGLLLTALPQTPKPLALLNPSRYQAGAYAPTEMSPGAPNLQNGLPGAQNQYAQNGNPGAQNQYAQNGNPGAQNQYAPNGLPGGQNQYAPNLVPGAPNPYVATGIQNPNATMGTPGAQVPNSQAGASEYQGPNSPTGNPWPPNSYLPTGALPVTTVGSTANATSSASMAAVVNAGAFFGSKLTDYRATLSGAVHRPGTYLIAPNTSLAEAIKYLGGLEQDADLSQFEITSTLIDNTSGTSKTSRLMYPATDEQLSTLLLRSYDRVEFRHVFSDRDTGEVLVDGEVRYPGTYSIMRNERLSSVLMRAGGLTDTAFPYGTVFLRRSVAEREAEQNKVAANTLRSQLLDVLVRPVTNNGASTNAETVMALQTLLTQIESQPVLGRISIIADPRELAADPRKDPILQTGDQVVVPKIPTSISVLGEVMRPGAFPIDPSMTARDYIDQAGGFTQFADDDRIVIVLPDGRAHLEQRSWLSLSGDTKLPPGTVVVVARDISGITIRQLVMDTSQIISQFATTAAALAVLSTSIK